MKRWTTLRTVLLSVSLLSPALLATGCAEMALETDSRGATDGSDGTWQNASPGPWHGGTDGSTGVDGTSGSDGTSEELPDNSGDKYSEVGTNPFVLTDADPFSTFAADVDTASYDIFRRDVGFGLLPQQKSVRLEEYVNYFGYDYPEPAGTDHPFSIDLAAAPSPFDNGTQMLRVGIRGKAFESMERKPANLVFLIDISGSMSSGSKLPLVQKVLTETLNVLEPADTVSIVTYAGSTGVALPPTPVSQKSVIADKINSFTAGGSTNGAGGLQLAYQQAEAAFLEDGINHVILCTDGDFNVGTTGDKGLVDFIVEKRKSGVTLTALGFGIGNLNDSMMEKVTNAGNGTYGVIDSLDTAIQYVHQRLLKGLYFIAKDMKIQVVFNPDQVLAYRLMGYENRDIADDLFTDDTIDAGEVGAGHTVTALYEVVLTGGAVPMADTLPPSDEPSPLQGEEMSVMPEELVRVAVRYKQPGASEADPAAEVSVGLTSEAVATSLDEADDDLRWAAAVAATAEVVKGSPYVTDTTLATARAIIEAGDANDPDRAEFQALFQALLTLLPAE